jgi:DUF2075 family protein
LIVRNGVIVTNAANRASSDSSVKGYKQLIQKDPKKGKMLIDKIIKNTYRTLMTRGMKGCFVYFTDRETREYFKSILKSQETSR